MILWPSYLHNGISYTDKMTSLFWIKALFAIHNLAPPTDKPALKRVLGSLNWLKKYIKNYSCKTHILYELLRKDIAFIWTDIHEQAFQEIKLSC